MKYFKWRYLEIISISLKLIYMGQKLINFVALRGKLKHLRFITILGIRVKGNTQMCLNWAHDKNNYFSKNMIVKTINLQVISVYESISIA